MNIPRASGWALLILPVALRADGLRTVADFQALAVPYKSEIRAPSFETTPDQIRADATAAMAAGDAAIDRIARQDPASATFESTFGALDEAASENTLVASRIFFIQQTSTSKEMRDTANEAAKKLQEWNIGLGYREDLYAALKSFADTKPQLSGEDQRLFDFTLRDYRRKGFELPQAARKEVEALFKEESPLETDFSSNVVNTRVALVFTRAELAGVPDSFLSSPGVKTGDDAYTILVSVTPQRMMVEQNCSVAETRRKVSVAELHLAEDVNVPLLNRIVALRAQIATKLGYASWDDYQIEVKMAKDGGTATRFVEDLIHGTKPKFDSEIAEMRALKVAETHDPAAQIDFTDWRYYQNQLVKQKYTIDAEALRVYFPFEHVLRGMFAIYQSIFGLKFEQLQAPYVWAEGVTMWGVTDAKSGEPMGLFYLDMFPREGKYNHFAEFPIQPGRLMPDGTYLRPTVALVCNFPPPSNGAPSLLNHQEVTTLFHEFGHCMHAILTRAHRGRFSGTSVPGDFVEAPSQMLGHLRRRLPRPVKEGPGGGPRAAPGGAPRHDGGLLPAATLVRPARPEASRAAAGRRPRRQPGGKQPDPGRGLLPGAGGLGVRRLLRASDGIRCRLLWLRMGRLDRRRHGDGVQGGPRRVPGSGNRHADAPGDLFPGRLPGRFHLNRGFPGPAAVERAVPQEARHPGVKKRPGIRPVGRLFPNGDDSSGSFGPGNGYCR